MYYFSLLLVWQVPALLFDFSIPFLYEALSLFGWPGLTVLFIYLYRLTDRKSYLLVAAVCFCALVFSWLLSVDQES